MIKIHHIKQFQFGRKEHIITQYYHAKLYWDGLCNINEN